MVVRGINYRFASSEVLQLAGSGVVAANEQELLEFTVNESAVRPHFLVAGGRAATSYLYPPTPNLNR